MSVVVKSPEDLNSALGAMGAEIKHIKESGDRTESELRSTVAKMTEEISAKMASAKTAAVQEAIEAAKAIRPGPGVDRFVSDGSQVKAHQILTADDVKRGAKIGGDVTHLGAEGKGVLQLLGVSDGVKWRSGYLDSVPETEVQAELQELVELRSLAKASGVRRTPKLDGAIRRAAALSGIPVLKVWADNSGEAAPFIPDYTMPMLERYASMPREVAAQFEEMQVSGGSSSIPFLTSGIQPFIAGVQAAGDMNPAILTPSVPVSTSLSAEPVTWAVNLPVNRDAEEDSIIDFAGLAQQLMAEAVIDGREDAIINADLNGGDTGLSAWSPRSRWLTLGQSNDHRKSYIGLRHIAHDESKSFDAASHKTPAQMLGKLSSLNAPMSFDGVVYFVSPEHYLTNMNTDSNVLTYDKMGDRATLVTGQVAILGGHKVVLSEFLTADTNASGVFDNTTKTKTGYLICNVKRFRRAVRRGPRFEISSAPERHLNYVVLTVRERFRRLDTTGTGSVAYGYNI